MNAPSTATAREFEAEMLKRCVAAARGLLQAAQDQREANVFRLAGMVLYSRFLAESKHLTMVSERYFVEHKNDLLPGDEVVQKGWVISLPRLRDMLSNLLKNT
jgi:hypothetical protein